MRFSTTRAFRAARAVGGDWRRRRRRRRAAEAAVSVTWDGTNGLGGLLCGRKSVGRNKCAASGKRTGKKDGEGATTTRGAAGRWGSFLGRASALGARGVAGRYPADADGTTGRGRRRGSWIIASSSIPRRHSWATTLRTPDNSGSGSVSAVFQSRIGVLEDFEYLRARQRSSDLRISDADARCNVCGV